ncbi:unnamed protein product, partial [Adineta steineri]
TTSSSSTTTTTSSSSTTTTTSSSSTTTTTSSSSTTTTTSSSSTTTTTSTTTSTTSTSTSTLTSTSTTTTTTTTSTTTTTTTLTPCVCTGVDEGLSAGGVAVAFTGPAFNGSFFCGGYPGSLQVYNGGYVSTCTIACASNTFCLACCICCCNGDTPTSPLHVVIKFEWGALERPKSGYYYASTHSGQTRNEKRFKLLFDAVLRQDIDKLAIVANVYEYPLVTWMTIKWIDNYLSVL